MKREREAATAEEDGAAREKQKERNERKGQGRDIKCALLAPRPLSLSLLLSVQEVISHTHRPACGDRRGLSLRPSRPLQHMRPASPSSTPTHWAQLAISFPLMYPCCATDLRSPSLLRPSSLLLIHCPLFILSRPATALPLSLPLTQSHCSLSLCAFLHSPSRLATGWLLLR